MPEKQKTSVKEVMVSLADSSSLHGVSKITSSRHLPVKVLWCLLFLAAFALLVRQMVDLFSAFYSYPIQTSISIQFSPLKLPAVTICNMNPVRKSAMEDLKALQILAFSYDKEALTDPDHEPVSTTTPISDTVPVETSPPLDTVDLDNGPTTPLNGPTQSLDEVVTADDLDIGPTPPLDEVMTPDDLGIGPTQPLDEVVSNGPTTPLDEVVTADDLGNGPIEPTPSQLPYSSASMSSSYFDHFNPNNSYDEQYIEDKILEQENDAFIASVLRQQLLSVRDKWNDRVMNMMNILKGTEPSLRQKLGHQPNIIHSVSFNGVVQNKSLFEVITTPEYGNCYTLSNPEKFIAVRSGPQHGLKITLNAEIDEYVDSFVASYGIKVVLHEPGTLPLPSEEGIILNPATETNVGLKVVSLERLGEPYAECTDGIWFERKYNFKYSVAACLSFCRALRIINTCRCIPIDSPDVVLNTTVLPVCNSSRTSVNNVCAKRTSLKFNNDYSYCDCISHCSETIYGNTISSRAWPGDSYLTELIEESCLFELRSMDKPCDQYLNKSLDIERYRQNFLQILLYFEDLNYERITEEPMYEPVRFLSDIGGACGLFLGASVLSFVEFLQLFMEICLYVYHKGREKTRSKVKDISIAKSTINAFKSHKTTNVRQIFSSDY